MLNFYLAFNTDAITICFPGMKSMNTQIFLLLFLTTILGYYTFGEKSHISILSMCLIFHTVKGKKINNFLNLILLPHFFHWQTSSDSL